MAQNSIAPGFIKLFYQSANASHTMVLPVRPYLTIGAEWWLNPKNQTPGNIWTSGITTFVNLLRGLMHTSATFQYAELWTVSAPGADPVFRETAQLAIAGTNAAASQVASQILFSFRTAEGGVGRIVLLDGVFAPNNRYLAPNYGNAAILAIVNQLVSNTSVNVGRDDGYIIAVPKVLTKTNDALRRKYGIVT